MRLTKTSLAGRRIQATRKSPKKDHSGYSIHPFQTREVLPTFRPISNINRLLDLRFGTLRWNDLPEPTAAKPVNSRLPDPGLTRPVNSRLVVNIDNQQGLCTIMKKLQHTYVCLLSGGRSQKLTRYRCVREIIQEKYMSVNGDIVFECRSRENTPDTTRNLCVLISQSPSNPLLAASY
jgi:hypothetical protein